MTSPYKEGQVFMLPVERGAYAVGLVARAPLRGGVVLGYFFGPRRPVAPVQEWLNGLHPQQAAFVCRFKDSALYRGEWPLLGMLAGFARATWPVPAFHRFDGSTTHAPGSNAITDWKVDYGDDNLIVPKAESPAAPADLKLAEDIAYDPQLLCTEVGQRIKEMVPTVGDATWR
jgi:hypothetical protein